MVRIMTVVATGAAIVAVAGCSSGTKKSAGPAAPPRAAQVTVASVPVSVPVSVPPSAPPSSSSATVATAGLSGTWDGHYSGSFSGTFTLNWTSTGSDLSGTIVLSSPGATLPIHGTVAGGRISFGTVGSTAITYTGSVSGAAMSGRYEVAGGAGGSGSWNAAKM